MLNAIKQTIQQIADFFSSVIDFVVGFIKDTISFISKIPEAVEEVTDLASSFFPPAILALFVSALAVVVILRVLGRD